MADSQTALLESVSDLGGLAHEVFVSDIVPSARFESVTAQLFQSADGDSDYTLQGSKMVWSTDLQRPVNALGTDGKLPDSDVRPTQSPETTVKRRYVRRAVDNVIEAQVGGRGAHEEIADRLVSQLWGAWQLMEIHHAVGGADATLCLVSSRTSSTVFVVKDGLGHTGSDPLMFMDEGMVICWHDSSASNAVAGAARITASGINYATSTITIDSAATWEPSATLGANDIICKATTNNIATDYFISERNNAPNGLRTLIDPDATATTVFNVSESTYPRWKPYRETIGTLDHITLTEHWRKLRAKSTMPVNAQTHTVLMNDAVHSELALSLVGFQQQQQLGKTLEGGYQTVRVAGMDLATDSYLTHDEVLTVAQDHVKYVNLVAEGYFDEDGSMYSRLADFDGKEFYARDACQYIADRRNCHAAGTGITLTNASAGDYTATPNY